MNSETEVIYNLILKNGQEISVTAEHPFYVMDYGWKVVRELSKGDVLKSSTGKPFSISNIKIEKENVQVYNFEVEATPNYFVTGSRILVHNKNIE